jgi:hypothetical protein
MKANAVHTRLNRLLLGSFIAVAAALTVLQVATAGPPTPGVDPSIAVGPGNKVFLVGHGVGVQIYKCNGAGTWSFVAPRADLFDDHGKLIIHHFGGPSWQANDGSTVVGKLDAPPLIKDLTAVPWLRLSIASRTAGPDGGDRLLDTSFIQRINTVGGVAPPASECNASTAGKVVEVPYTADYIFYKATGAPVA